MASKDNFMRLFIPLQGDFLAFILSMGVLEQDAQDLLQDSATVMLKKVEQFEEGSNFKAWAFAIIRNEILHFRRSKATSALKLSEETCLEIEEIYLSEAPSLRGQMLSTCLGKLKKSSRKMVELRYSEEVAVGKIAQEFGSTADSISSRLWKIRAALEECVRRLENSTSMSES